MSKRCIEIYWSLIGGFGLALFTDVMSQSGGSSPWLSRERFFQYERWFDLGYLDFRGKFDKIIGTNGTSLIVGFLLTYFLIYTIKRYRQVGEE